MKQFEYEISKHPDERFGRLAVFCSGTGECSFEQLPDTHTAVLAGIMNERGARGWELVNLFFGDGGVVAVWKREKDRQ